MGRGRRLRNNDGFCIKDLANPKIEARQQDRGAVSEWSIEAVLKTVERDERSVGSNPTCSATLLLRSFLHAT